MGERRRELYIHDNLPVLRGLEKDSVDMIYLDPPYNSKKAYSAPIGTKAEGQKFDDTWRWTELDTAWLGEIDRRCAPLSSVIESVRAVRGDGDAAYCAMMGIRMIQMNRVLKPSGSIYLHCDDTANHLLRFCMDAVFKKGRYLNEIVWRRYGSHNDPKKWGRVCDRILYYAGKGKTWNPPLIPLDKDTLDRDYRNKDEKGRFSTSPLHARGLTGGGYEGVWRGIRDVWKFNLTELDKLDEQGLIYWPPKGKVPRRKVYYDPNSGKPMADLMDDIGYVSGKEYTGWKTQKPLALLQRLIRASSNPGDLVLDPFCGCATACVAAEIEGRQWIGIDACKAANDITRVRLSEVAIDWLDEKVKVFHIPPKNLELVETNRKSRNYRTSDNIDLLYGNQRGDCPGCGGHYRVKDFHMGHIVPITKLGGDEVANLQLLCGHCNSTKADGTMNDLWNRLVEKHVISSQEATLLQAKWRKKHQPPH